MAKDKDAAPAAETPAVAGPRQFRVKTRGEGGPEAVVNADTVEDAVRAFNGEKTNYPLKQLVVEPVV